MGLKYKREVILPPEQFDLRGPVYGLGYTLAGPDYSARVFIDFINQRLRVLDYDGRDTLSLAGRLQHLAAANKLGKIIWAARAQDRNTLLACTYREEAFFPGFFTGTDAWFLSLFLDPGRAESQHLDTEEELLTSIKRRQGNGARPLPPGFTLGEATREDIPALCQLYRDTFSTYPSPVTEPAYLEEELGAEAIFQVIYHDGKLVSAASAEIDRAHACAEITDCATRPEFRGLGLIHTLILALEAKLARHHLLNTFSLARATSAGMNAALYSLGYSYQGRLRNNCHIGGGFEDMNLWVKRLKYPQL